MAKYDPLCDYLDRLPPNAVTISFETIADLVGGLPHSAYAHRPWWANEVDGQHVQARAWLEASRHVESVDLASRSVRFGPRS